MHSLASCVLHLHVVNKAFLTIFEVTNMTGPIIFGRAQAKAMGYVEFPKIMCPNIFITHPIISKIFARYRCQRLQPALHLQIQLIPHPEYMYTKVSQPR